MRRTTICGLLLICSLCLTGCSGENIQKADVSGVITLDGAPLADVEVNFVNDESGFAGFGKTNSEGEYQLVQGAAIGKNRVFFSKLKTSEHYDEDPESGLDDGQLEAAAGFDVADGAADVGQQIPTTYTADNSKLTFEVSSGGASDADFKLSSE